jgi:hypothetical protein
MKTVEFVFSTDLTRAFTFRDTIIRSGPECFKVLQDRGLVGIHEYGITLEEHISASENKMVISESPTVFYTQDANNDVRITDTVASCFVIQKILATLGTISLGYLNFFTHDSNFIIDQSGTFVYGSLTCPIIKLARPGVAYKITNELMTSE